MNVTSVSYTIPFDVYAPINGRGEYDVPSLQPVADALYTALRVAYPDAIVYVGLDHSEYMQCDFRAHSRTVNGPDLTSDEQGQIREYIEEELLPLALELVEYPEERQCADCGRTYSGMSEAEEYDGYYGKDSEYCPKCAAINE